MIEKRIDISGFQTFMIVMTYLLVSITGTAIFIKIGLPIPLSAAMFFFYLPLAKWVHIKIKRVANLKVKHLSFFDTALIGLIPKFMVAFYHITKCPAVLFINLLIGVAGTITVVALLDRNVIFGRRENRLIELNSKLSLTFFTILNSCGYSFIFAMGYILSAVIYYKLV